MMNIFVTPQVFAQEGTGETYNTNLTGFKAYHPQGQVPTWEETQNGLEINGYYEDDIFYLAEQSSADFVLETDLSTTRAAGLVVHSSNNPYDGSYSIQLDAGVKKVRLIYQPWPGSFAQEVDYDVQPGQSYHLRVVSRENNLKVYIDNAEEPTIDYTAEKLSGGQVGIYHNNGHTVVQNTILNHFNTNLKNITCVADDAVTEPLEWTVEQDGIAMSGYHVSDVYGLADNKGKNFTVEADISGTLASGLAIHCGDDPRADSMLVQLDFGAKEVRLIGIPFTGFNATAKYEALEPGTAHHLKVVSQDDNIKVYLDRAQDPIIDYQSETPLKEGRVALYHNNGDTKLQNVFFTTEDGGDGVTPIDPYVIKNAGFEDGKKNWTMTGDLMDQPISSQFGGKEGRYCVNTGKGPIWYVSGGKLHYSRSDTGDHLASFEGVAIPENVTVEATLNLSNDTIFSIPVRGTQEARQGGFLVILTPGAGTVRFIQLPYVGELKVVEGVSIPSNKDFQFKMNLYDVDGGIKVEVFIDGEQVMDYTERNRVLHGDRLNLFSFQGSGTVDNLKVTPYGGDAPAYENSFDNPELNLFQQPGTSNGYLPKVGAMTSDPFKIKDNYIKFLMGGTVDNADLSVSVADMEGNILGTVSPRSQEMKYCYIDVSAYKEQTARIVITDNSQSGWLAVDSFEYAADRSMSDEVSLLEAQVGYHPNDVKHAYLRSSYEKPYIDPAEKEFVIKNAAGEEVCRGEITYWGEKWGSYWWIANFSSVKESGAYTVEVAGENMVSAPFQIREDIFTNSQLEEGNEDQLNLVQIAMDQLDYRLKKFSDPGAVQLEGWDSEYIPGWRDCGSEIRELSSHIVTLHALVDMFENPNIYNNLTKEYKTKLIEQITWGADYLVFAQESSENPLTDGRFNHDAGRQTNYGTTDFHNWHGSAYVLTVLPRVYGVFAGSNPDLAKKYLDCAEKAYQNAVYRPYNLSSDLYGKSNQDGVTYDGDETGYVNSLARTVYNGDGDWSIPETLKTKDKLAFIWACTQLYTITGKETYFDSAVAFAASAAERQFTDFENPIDGVFGNFYAYEGNDDIFELEWNQNHRYHMGNIEPTNLKGFMELLTLAPTHPEAAKWYNVIKTYGDNYAKGTAALSPLGIYPLTMYKDDEFGGVSFFKATNHGFTGMYGQIAKNFMELGAFLNDNEYQVLANNNLEFVAGLNPGIPTTYAEYAWYSQSLINGLGNNSFAAKGDGLATPPGSGQNGFSADVQFAPTPIGNTPDAPKGILNPDGSYQFNESYLPHSHGYVSGVAKLEGNYTLTVKAQDDGVPVAADVTVILNGASSSYNMVDGQVVIEDLPLMQSGKVTVTYGGKTVEKEIDTIASGDYTLDVDFSKNIAVTVDVPATLSESTAKGSVTIENLSSVSHDVELTLSADGVALDKADYSLTIGAGQSATQEFTLTAGYKVMPYAVLCAASVGGKETFAVGEGRVASTALRSQKSFTVSASSNGGGALSCEEQNTVLEGDGLTVIFTPDEGKEIKDVLVDGVSKGARGAYVFSNVQENHTLQVVFSEGDVTAQDIADGIKNLPGIKAGDKAVKLPEVPEGFSIAVSSSSNASVIALDGTITPIMDDAEVTLVLTVSNGMDTAETAPITVTVPGLGIWRVLLGHTIKAAEEAKENYPPHLIEEIRVKFEAALFSAQELYQDFSATDAELMAADDELIRMMHYLSFTADKSGLEAAIKHAKEVIESKLYLEDENMADYKALLTEAEALLNEPATDTEYTKMISALEEAEDKLVPVPVVSLDLKALRHVLEMARDIDLREYLDLPANKVFTTAREKAEDILTRAEAGDKSVTQKLVDDATAELHAALLDLRKIPSKDKLKELLGEANAKDLSLYTKESGAVLKLAVDLAKAVYDDPLSDEDDVKAAEAVLAAAIDNLVPIKNGGANEPGGDSPTGDGGFAALPLSILLLCAGACLVTLRKKRA